MNRRVGIAAAAGFVATKAWTRCWRCGRKFYGYERKCDACTR